MADFGDDLEIEGDVLASKRSHEDDDKSDGESDGTSGTLASTESDADVVPEKVRRRRAYHKPRPPRKKNPPAFIQLSPPLQSELKKLQQVATRGSGVSRKRARLQTKPSQCCNLAAGHLMWQQRSPRTRQVGEDSTSLKISQWMLMTTGKTRHQKPDRIEKPKQERL